MVIFSTNSTYISLQVVIVAHLNTIATTVVAVAETKIATNIDPQVAKIIIIRIIKINTAAVPVVNTADMATVVAAAAVISTSNYLRKLELLCFRLRPAQGTMFVGLIKMYPMRSIEVIMRFFLISCYRK